MESWRRAWQGQGRPVQPFKDAEWVERRKEFLAEHSDLRTASDEVAGHEYRIMMAQWLVDHVDVLEEAGEISSETAAQIRGAAED